MKKLIKVKKVFCLYTKFIALIMLSIVTNIFRINKNTHVFYYSKEQKHCTDGMVRFSLYLPINYTFKGKEYTEMKHFKYGISNWEDAVILGIGGNHSLKKIKK